MIDKIVREIKNKIKDEEKKKYNNEKSAVGKAIKDNKPKLVMKYQGQISEAIRKIGYKEGVQVAFRNNKKLGNWLNNKNQSVSDNGGCVYCIPCGCGTKYVGETGRDLGIRIKEHKADIKNLRSWKPLPAHMLKCTQPFIWNDVNILAKENNDGPRKVIEGLFIQRNKLSLCNLSAGFNVDKLWEGVVEKIDLKI